MQNEMTKDLEWATARPTCIAPCQGTQVRLAADDYGPGAKTLEPGPFDLALNPMEAKH